MIAEEVQPAQADPILSKTSFPYRCRFHPLGFPLDLYSNAVGVLDAARASWRHYPAVFEEEPVRLEIGVLTGGAEGLCEPPVYRARNHLFQIVSSQRDFISVDTSTGFGFGWMNEATLRHPAFARHYFLDAAVLTMLDQLYLAPVHAALVARNDSGVLLCGDSFAGKSTLAYACASAGWTYVTDDGAFLVRSSNDRWAIGNPFLIRLREAARQLFPELAGRVAAIRPNGKIGIEISTPDLGNMSLATGAHVDHVVFLNRRELARPALFPLTEHEARARLHCRSYYGSATVEQARLHAYERLYSARFWQLDYATWDAALGKLELLNRP